MSKKKASGWIKERITLPQRYVYDYTNAVWLCAKRGYKFKNEFIVKCIVYALFITTKYFLFVCVDGIRIHLIDSSEWLIYLHHHRWMTWIFIKLLEIWEWSMFFYTWYDSPSTRCYTRIYIPKPIWIHCLISFKDPSFCFFFFVVA